LGGRHPVRSTISRLAGRQGGRVPHTGGSLHGAREGQSRAPPHFTILKHTGWIASERSVRAHETRPDGRALAEGTGYQASYRYGSHQSITRGWLPPMHQTDSLFHKATGGMKFVFGFDVDNHAVNTVPKETLVRIVKAEDGGLGGQGAWQPPVASFEPAARTEENLAYLSGQLTRIGAADEGYGDGY